MLKKGVNKGIGCVLCEQENPIERMGGTPSKFLGICAWVIRIEIHLVGLHGFIREEKVCPFGRLGESSRLHDNGFHCLSYIKKPFSKRGPK